MKSKVVFSAIVASVFATGCTAFTTNQKDYILIRPYQEEKALPTLILAHGCDGFAYSKGQSYRSRALLFANRYNFNVILYDAFTPRGWKSDEVCTGERGAGGNAVPPIKRVKDSIEIYHWITKQSWHSGKVGFVGYSHGGSVALAISNDSEASKLFSATVAYYPNCNEQYIGSKINNPKISTMVHLGDADHWTPMFNCLLYRDANNYSMHVYKDATHAWEVGYSGMAIGKWRIKFDPEATNLSEERTVNFLNNILRN